MRESKIQELVDAITALGHEVRKDETSDTPTVHRLRNAFKQARVGATPPEEKEAWKRVGDK